MPLAPATGAMSGDDTTVRAVISEVPERLFPSYPICVVMTHMSASRLPAVGGLKGG
jgi:hypothetical protein